MIMEKRKKFSYIGSVKILKTANHSHLWRERERRLFDEKRKMHFYFYICVVNGIVYSKRIYKIFPIPNYVLY